MKRYFAPPSIIDQLIQGQESGFTRNDGIKPEQDLPKQGEVIELYTNNRDGFFKAAVKNKPEYNKNNEFDLVLNLIG